MKIFIKFILALHVLPLFVLGWLTLFDLTEFSNSQWRIAWFMTFASLAILSAMSMDEEIIKVENVKK